MHFRTLFALPAMRVHPQPAQPAVPVDPQRAQACAAVFASRGLRNPLLSSPYRPVLTHPTSKRVLPGVASPSSATVRTVGIGWLALELAPAGQTGAWVGVAVLPGCPTPRSHGAVPAADEHPTAPARARGAGGHHPGAARWDPRREVPIGAVGARQTLLA
jgi:hypothetical protein